MMFVLFCLYCFLNCFLFAGKHDGAALFDTCSLFFVSFSFFLFMVRLFFFTIYPGISNSCLFFFDFL